MKHQMKNVSDIDRLGRLILGVIFGELAYFWLPDAWQIAAYMAGVLMISTAVVRFCPLYKLFGIRAAGGSVPFPRASLRVLSTVVLLGTVLGGGYASIFFSRKLFLEDFNAMNNNYKQTLFLTGKNQREKALEITPNSCQLTSSFSASTPITNRMSLEAMPNFRLICPRLPPCFPM